MNKVCLTSVCFGSFVNIHQSMRRSTTLVCLILRLVPTIKIHFPKSTAVVIYLYCYPLATSISSPCYRGVAQQVTSEKKIKLNGGVAQFPS